MKTILIVRCSENERAIYGNIYILQNGKVERIGTTIENKVKAVKTGVYDIEIEYSPKFKRNLWELKGIKGRSEIKIHVANYYTQLDGCIGVGSDFKYIDYDEVIDVSNSKKTLDILHDRLKDLVKTKIQII